MKPEQADWRLNPVTERELAEDRRRERRKPLNTALLVLAYATVCPLSCLGACFGSSSAGSAVFLLVPVVGIAAIVAVVGRSRNDQRLTTERRLALRQEFGGVGGWLVEMTVHQGEAISGRDIGTVWFEDERLYFAGTRTSFGLGAGDTQRRILDPGAVIDSGIGLVLPIRERTVIGSVSIGLRFIAPEPELSPMVSEAGFRHAAETWIKRGEESRGQLPPLTPGPGLPSLASLRGRARLATLLWPCLLGLVVLVGLRESALIPIVSLVAVSAALWAPGRSPRRAWRAVHDRESLEAYNRDQ